MLKQKKLIGYFVQNQQSPYYQSARFTHVLNYVQQNQRACKMKEKNNKLSLVFENVTAIHQAISVIEPLCVLTAVPA